MKECVKVCVFSVAILLFSTSLSYGTITVDFPEVDIGGGIKGSATATIEAGPGYLDIIVENTSPLGPTIDSQIANPFITEIEFKYLPESSGFTLDEASSYVESYADTYFAKGVGNTALQLGQQNLYYSFVPSDSSGMDRCLMTLEADDLRNDNTIASLIVLDGSNIPQEGHANGFLNDSPSADSGAIFDKARFHFAFFGSGTPDENFYGDQATLVVKFVGGGDYSYKSHVYNVPEPTTLAILGLGALLLRKRRV